MDQGHVMLYAGGHVMTLPEDQRTTLWARHSATRTAVANLPSVDLAPGPPRAFSPGELAWAREVEGTAPFKRTFQDNPHEFGWVPMDRLTTFQPFLNPLIHAPPAPGLDVVEWCLPKQFSTSGQTTFDPAVPSRVIFTTTDPNADFNIETDPKGVHLRLTPRLNWVQVVRARNRYVVKNGYHRIVALAASGHKEVPAIVTDAADLAQLIPPGQNWFNAAYLQPLPRPPLVIYWRTATEIGRPTFRSSIDLSRERSVPSKPGAGAPKPSLRPPFSSTPLCRPLPVRADP